MENGIPEPELFFQIEQELIWLSCSCRSKQAHKAEQVFPAFILNFTKRPKSELKELASLLRVLTRNKNSVIKNNITRLSVESKPALFWNFWL